MNLPAPAGNELVFGWEKPGRGKWTLGGFLVGSFVLHAFGFYLFQIVYPPAVALLPPPGRISLISPTTDEGRLLLSWVEAEDPALASTTQAMPETKALALPTIQHAPSYLGHRPALKDLPPPPPPLRIPSARPPAPVEKPAAPIQFVTRPIATAIRFSPELSSLIPPQVPELKFDASTHDSPQAARFLIAVSPNGDVRYCFLQSSSGDPRLDDQARKYVALTRFPAIRNSSSGNASLSNAAESSAGFLTWGTATLEWGNDVSSPASASPNPTAP